MNNTTGLVLYRKKEVKHTQNDIPMILAYSSMEGPGQTEVLLWAKTCYCAPIGANEDPRYDIGVAPSIF